MHPPSICYYSQPFLHPFYKGGSIQHNYRTYTYRHGQHAGCKVEKFISVATSILLAMAVMFCGFVMFQIHRDGYVTIAGCSVFHVVSGSMEPEIPVHSLLICKKTPIERIQVGDIVCFKSLNPKLLGSVVTHRVVSINTDQGKTKLETKGDANLTADVEWVDEANLIGKVNYSTNGSNIFASVVDVMTDKIGFLVLILFPTLLIAGFILRSCMMSMRRGIEEAIAEEKQIQEQKKKGYTPEEYAQMCERIKQELLEELKHDAEEQGAIGSETE